MATRNGSKNGSKKRKKKKKSAAKKPILLLLIAVICLLGILYGTGLLEFGGGDLINRPTTLPDGTIEVHFIDVGQGDSILIKTESGNMLVDAGPNSAEDSLDSYLKAQGVTSFTYAVFTHMDEDHIGGGDMIENNYTIETTIVPKQISTTTTYERLLNATEKNGCKVEQAISGTTYSLGEMQFTVLAPNAESYKDSNNYSVVLRVDYGETSMLLTGDAEVDSEEEILAKYNAATLSCNLLKCGHHGSNTSTSQSFLDAVNPTVAVISCGKDNKYGHPKQETLDKLEKKGITVYRTDKLGSVVFSSDGKTLTYREP